jgi:hypothetical protein
VRRRVATPWRRSRDWPVRDRIAFALFVVFVVAAVTIAIVAAAHAPDASPRAAAITQPRVTTSTTAPGPEATRFAQKPSGLIALKIASQSHATAYDRLANFGGWTDQRGCQDTRAALLIRTSRVPVTYTDSHQCAVKTGRWTDPWSGVSTTVAHDLHVDHTVPLENAWVSGAWSWTHAQRVAYANDLTDTDHLVLIDASENESKGAGGPDEWRPPRRSTWCQYALAWDYVKVKWHLSATQREWTALREMAATCHR